ncbi:MAG: methionyl-tRNA formyltransferase, partial [Deltaproteobacteria bacterium]
MPGSPDPDRAGGPPPRTGPLRIVFMGTPDFAVPSLDALVAAGHDVIAVVAQPDRPKGRGRKPVSPPTIVRARQLGIETRQPRAINRGPFREWFTRTPFDVAVVVAYGRILKPWHLNAPARGCINVHASLLPEYRGAAPIHHAILDGRDRTGVCTMQMDEGLDTGDILLCRETPIGPDETTAELWDRLAHMGAALLVETLDRLDEIEPRPQDHGRATLAPPLTRADGRVDWTWPADRVHNRIRGMNSWPGAWTRFRGADFKL